MCRPKETSASEMARLLPETSQPGVYVRSARFQEVVDALQRGFFQLREAEAGARFQSSGFLPREDLVRSSYVEKFPQFVTRVSAELSEPAESGLVTLPSACLSLYPVIAERRTIPEDGLLATVAAPCFRNEAGYGPERMRAFHMAEYVFFGDEGRTQAFRDDVLKRVQSWLVDLGLSARVASASDPFYGRVGEILAERQLAANLKLEVILAIDGGKEIAAFSVNDHKDFFCLRWDLRLADGAVGESSCVGVGLERLALAMFHQHGSDLDGWPHAFTALL